MQLRLAPIPTFPGYYAHADTGTIYSTRTGGKLKKIGRRDGAGHIQLCVRRHGRNFRRYIHELILTTFAGDRPPGLVARHLNGNEQDNRLANLAWGTRSANNIDRHLHRGNGISGLTATDVRAIRQAVAARPTTISHAELQAQLAAKFNLSKNAVGCIVSRRTWDFVD